MFRRDFFKGLFGGATALELPAVKSAEILRLQDGDTIVLKIPGRATDYETLSRIRDVMQSRFPNNKILVMEETLDISVIKG